MWADRRSPSMLISLHQNKIETAIHIYIYIYVQHIARKPTGYHNTYIYIYMSMHTCSSLAWHILPPFLPLECCHPRKRLLLSHPRMSLLLSHPRMSLLLIPRPGGLQTSKHALAYKYMHTYWHSCLMIVFNIWLKPWTPSPPRPLSPLFAVPGNCIFVNRMYSF